MSAEPVPPPSPNTNLGTSGLSSNISSLPLWDRVTLWASENKAIVYTIAGVAVAITGAGVAYHLSDSGSKDSGTEKKRSTKEKKRKAKQEKDKSQGQSDSRQAEQCGL